MPAVERRRTGALTAGAGGLLLLASMFLPWFALDVAVELPDRFVNAEDARLNAWQAFSWIDLVLCASAALALAFALGRPNPLLPTAVAIAGALCALLIVLRLLDPPDLGLVLPGDQTGVGRRIGAFFGLLGAAGMAWGAGAALATPGERSARPEVRPARLDDRRRAGEPG